MSPSKEPPAKLLVSPRYLPKRKPGSSNDSDKNMASLYGENNRSVSSSHKKDRAQNPFMTSADSYHNKENRNNSNDQDPSEERALRPETPTYRAKAQIENSSQTNGSPLSRSAAFKAHHRRVSPAQDSTSKPNDSPPSNVESPYKGLGGRSRAIYSPPEQRLPKKTKTKPFNPNVDSDDEEQKIIGQDGKPVCVKVGVLSFNPEVKIVAKFKRVTRRDGRQTLGFYTCSLDRDNAGIEPKGSWAFEEISFLDRFTLDDDDEMTKDLIREELSVTDFAPLRNPTKRSTGEQQYKEESSDDEEDSIDSSQAVGSDTESDKEILSRIKANTGFVHRSTRHFPRDLVPEREKKERNTPAVKADYDKGLPDSEELSLLQELSELEKTHTLTASRIIKRLEELCQAKESEIASLKKRITKDAGIIQLKDQIIAAKKEKIKEYRLREVENNNQLLRGSSGNLLGNSNQVENPLQITPQVNHPKPLSLRKTIDGNEYSVLSGKNEGFLQGQVKNEESFLKDGKRWCSMLLLQEATEKEKELTVPNMVEEKLILIDGVEYRDILKSTGESVVIRKRQTVVDEDGKMWRAETFRAQLKTD